MVRFCFKGTRQSHQRAACCSRAHRMPRSHGELWAAGGCEMCTVSCNKGSGDWLIPGFAWRGLGELGSLLEMARPLMNALMLIQAPWQQRPEPYHPESQQVQGKASCDSLTHQPHLCVINNSMSPLCQNGFSDERFNSFPCITVCDTIDPISTPSLCPGLNSNRWPGRHLAPKRGSRGKCARCL